MYSSLVKIIFILVFILISLTSEARINVGMMGGTPVADADFCTACPDATNKGSLICEEWDASTDGICGWTVVEEDGDLSNGSVDLSAACDDTNALGCDHIDMGDCAEFSKSGTGTDKNLYAYKAISTGTAYYIQFYVKIISETIADTNAVELVALRNTASGHIVRIQLYQSTSLYFRLSYYYDTETPTEATDVGGTAISVNGTTWYGVRMAVLNSASAGADSVQWWVDYNQDGDYVDAGEDEVGASGFDFAYAIDEVRLGKSSTALRFNYQISGLKIDGSSMPDECTRTP